MKNPPLTIKLPQDKGTTSIAGMSLQNAADGISKCISNAEELIEDALYLEQKGRKARALSLFIMALEENSKAAYILTESMFTSASPRINKEVTKRFLKKFRGALGHRSKQEFGLGIDMLESFRDPIKEKTDQLSSFKLSHEVSQKLQPHTEKARQDGLYVNFLGGKFLSPDESLNKNSHFSQNISYQEFKEMVLKQVAKSRQIFGKDRQSCISYLKLMRFLITPEGQEILENKLQKSS